MNWDDQNQSLSRQNMRVCKFFYVEEQLICSRTVCYFHDQECEFCENSYLEVEWEWEEEIEASTLQLQAWFHCYEWKNAVLKAL